MLHVKLNYKNMYKDKPNGLNCSLCLNEPESELHAVNCSKLPERFNHPYEKLFFPKRIHIWSCNTTFRKKYGNSEKNTGRYDSVTNEI